MGEGHLRALTLFFAAGLVGATFADAFALWPYHDDWEFALMAADALRGRAVGEFVLGPLYYHWSPLAAGFHAFNVWLVGLHADWLIRSFNAASVFALLVAFALLGRRLSLSGPATVVGMSFLAFAQVNAHPYYGFDGYTQLWSDALASLSLTMVLLAMSGADYPRHFLVVSQVLFILALGVKESAASVVPGMWVLVWWFHREPTADARRRRALLATTVSATFLAAVLVAGHAMTVGAAVAEDPYLQPCAACVPEHVVLMVAGTYMPANLLDFYVAFRTLGWSAPTVITGVVIGVPLALIIMAGLLAWQRSTASSRLGLYVMLLLTSALGTAFLGRVFERHAHALVFWAALLVAFAWDGWKSSTCSWRRRVAHAAIGVVIGMHATALADKRGEIRASGERARVLAQQLDDVLAAIPPNSQVVLWDWESIRGWDDYDQIRITPPTRLLSRHQVVAAMPASITTLRGIDQLLLDGPAAGPSAAAYALRVTDQGISFWPLSRLSSPHPGGPPASP